jgi:clan AA aspartic protease
VTLGSFRDGHPRITLALGGMNGRLTIEFIVDTGFAGGPALPGHRARQIDLQPSSFRDWMLANGAMIKCPIIDADVEWEDEPRRTEVLVLGGNPLVGTQFLEDCLLQVQMNDGGEVVIEPL